MKYSIVFKFLAILLCAACLLVSVAAGIGIFALAESDLYNRTVDQLRMQQYEQGLYHTAEQIVELYVKENLTNLSDDLAEHYYWALPTFDREKTFFQMRDSDGNLVNAHIDETAVAGVDTYSVSVYGIVYPTALNHRVIEDKTGRELLNINLPVPEENAKYEYHNTFTYEDITGIHQYRLGMRVAPEYEVTIYLTEYIYQEDDHWSWDLAEFGYLHRYNIIWVLGASLLLFAVFFVYLCCAAGRKPKSEEVCPGGLNRLPLDLYAVLAGGAVLGIVILGWELLENFFDWYDPQWMLVPAAAAMAFVACLIAVAFLFACAAQFKMKQFYWVKHSLTGMVLVAAVKVIAWCLRKLGKGGKWLLAKLPPVCKKNFEVLKNIVVALWELIVKIWKTVWSLVGRLLRFLWHTLQRFSQLLPLTWQWLLVGLAMIFVLLVSFGTRNTAMQFLGIAMCICIVMYGAHCFGVLLEATKRMSKGDLDTKVEDKLLLGGFQEYATGLNGLADVAVEAAKNQMKSERMKAELVTNVSHDIKTPLTNIINYVDLLKKAQTQEEVEEYLEVLDRQSLRLKKLIEDLMEMSKASTGNMTVDLTAVNAVEAVNQALGEFSEKLEKAQLTPVFNPPEDPVMITADGRLTWRVLSNLLGNAVKYALPGTRLYIDLVAVNGQVLISLKNISKEQLNVSSEELMERFVRGDASRNTEGSGLGLNIARSLMELQKGQLQLLVDGDLFKATLIFPENGCS